MEYEIMLGGQAVGKAAVERQGLYYTFSCRCSLQGEGMFCVTALCGENRENLGVLVPENGSFTLRTRVPVKRLGEGRLRFEVTPKHPQLRGKFVPLSPEEPFRYLQRLENAYLKIQNGQVGVVIPVSIP